MEKKNKNKKMFIIFLIGFVIGLIGLTTSFVMYLNVEEKKEDVIPKKDVSFSKEEIYGDIVFNSIDSSVYLDKVIPTLDKFGVLNEPFSFSIKNNGRETKKYTLFLIDNGGTINNKDIRYELTKNNKVIGIYSLDSNGVIDVGQIKNMEEINYSIKIWLDYDSNIKVGTFNKKISISTNNYENQDELVNKPILIDGMIPVYYDNNTYSWIKSDIVNTYQNEWYNYSDKKWANAVTVDSLKRDEYLNSPIGTKIENQDINAYWVWIPRFSYSKDNIMFVDNSKEAYPAFHFDNYEIDGFWISKFEAGMNTDSLCAKSSLTIDCNNSDNKMYFVPNYLFVNRMTMANQFYAIRTMESKDNIYGFKSNSTKLNNDGTIKNDNNNIDTHMLKNTEWQAVALLSNSKYGKIDNNKNNLIINNNSLYTGKCSIDGIDYDYNVVARGEEASTTGNIYGVYDMSGGKREYVMINNDKIDLFNKKSNSGFTTKVKDYYYDNDFNEFDQTLINQDKYSNDNLINNEPITRGGYKNTGNIFNVYCAKDYLNKISMESNSRASLVIVKEK